MSETLATPTSTCTRKRPPPDSHPGVRDSHHQRQEKARRAINAPIQGSAMT